MEDTATQLITKVQEHFRTHKELVNIMEIFNDIPFIAWWQRDTEGGIIACSKQLEHFFDILTPEQISQFNDICEISDKYTKCSYDSHGLRRPAVFYEVLEIPNCDIRGVWKTTKIARPINEVDINKCHIFAITYMQDMIHGSFEAAHNRLMILAKNNMVVKISDNVYMNKSKGYY